ncbi:hypothetical protein EXIGLDRAFT_763484 [Exidia glandulosa HHB12029]|uniref:Uncharacterized protein n=1 Tax=Exidia glandulosa HHB12029 TaxID=1314781 RepID=A0A165LXX4_EXIGL|nr:hypothetical protein EXIGLDRAFT_763484 [Exidia glandulosa HHB12029]
MLNSFENALRITLDAERQAAEKDDNNWPPVGRLQHSATYSTSTVDDVQNDFRSQDDAGERFAGMYLERTLLAPEGGFANMAPPPHPGAHENANLHAKLRVINLILAELERELPYPASLSGTFRRSSRSTSPCLDNASQIPEHTAGPQPLVRINSSPLYVAPTALSDMCGPGYFDSRFTFELTALPQLSSPLPPPCSTRADGHHDCVPHCACTMHRMHLSRHASDHRTFLAQLLAHAYTPRTRLDPLAPSPLASQHLRLHADMAVYAADADHPQCQPRTSHTMQSRCPRVSMFDRTIFSRLRAQLESHLPPRSDHQFGAAGSYQEEHVLVKLVTKYSYYFRTGIVLEHLAEIARDVDGDLNPTPETQQAEALTAQVERRLSYDLCGTHPSARDVMLSYAEANSWLELKKRALSDEAYQRRATALYSAGQAYVHSRRLLREIQFAYKQGVLHVYCGIYPDIEVVDDKTRNVLEIWIAENNRDENKDTGILVQLESRVAAAEGRSTDSAARLAEWEEDIRRWRPNLTSDQLARPLAQMTGRDLTALLPPEIVRRFFRGWTFEELQSALAVSTEWRAVALDHPAYWQNISLTSMSPSDAAVELALLRIRLTHGRPFSLSIWAHYPSVSLARVFHAVAAHLWHIVNLSLVIHGRDSGVAFAALLHSAPLLESFHLSFWLYPDLFAEPTLPSQLFSNDAPALRHVGLITARFDAPIPVFRQVRNVLLGTGAEHLGYMPLQSLFANFPGAKSVRFIALSLFPREDYGSESLWKSLESVAFQLAPECLPHAIHGLPLHCVPMVRVEHAKSAEVGILCSNLDGDLDMTVSPDVFDDLEYRFVVNLRARASGWQRSFVEYWHMWFPRPWHDLFDRVDIAQRIVFLAISFEILDAACAHIRFLPSVAEVTLNFEPSWTGDLPLEQGVYVPDLQKLVFDTISRRNGKSSRYIYVPKLRSLELSPSRMRPSVPMNDFMDVICRVFVGFSEPLCVGFGDGTIYHLPPLTGAR